MDANYQTAMKFASAMSGLFACQADVNVLPTSEYWAKLVESYCKKNKPDLRMTISNFKTFYTLTGRFLSTYVYEESGLLCHFDAIGACVWVHHWEKTDDGLTIRCFHGLKMINKPITYTLSPDSEEANKALQSGEGKIEKGKNQKDIVKLVNTENIVCPNDKDVTFPVLHANNSCAMNFSNYRKANLAFLHNFHWTAAMFPKANKADLESKMIIITKCFCNYGAEVPQIGRQLCKMTAYEIPGSGELDEEQCNSEMLKATAKYKNTFVFQCCNPTFKKSNRNERNDLGKHCDFKISLIDVRVAMNISKEMWSKTREAVAEFEIAEPKLKLPIFSFDPKKHCFKNAIVVDYDISNEDDPFC